MRLLPVLLLLAGCSLEMAPNPAPPEIILVWSWDVEREYAAEEVCWIGIDPATGLHMHWESLRDHNLGHRPVMYGTEPVSPDWWRRIR